MSRHVTPLEIKIMEKNRTLYWRINHLLPGLPAFGDLALYYTLPALVL